MGKACIVIIGYMILIPSIDVGSSPTLVSPFYLKGYITERNDFLKELIYLGTDISEFKGKKYNVSTFIDVFNYEILRATDLSNFKELVKGNKYLCDLDVKYNSNQHKFVFYVTKVSI